MKYLFDDGDGDGEDGGVGGDEDEDEDEDDDEDEEEDDAMDDVHDDVDDDYHDLMKTRERCVALSRSIAETLGSEFSSGRRFLGLTKHLQNRKMWKCPSQQMMPKTLEEKEPPLKTG